MKFPKSKDEEPTAPGQIAIRKRSRVPGVMITQFVEEVPQGKSHPDFSRKPIALTIQEGKFAVFKAIVTGNPTPTVRWTRNNEEISESEQSIIKYEAVTGEHQLQMPNVAVDQAGTYKCLAENEFGRAIVTATLNIIEVGFKKSKELQESRTAQREQPADFKSCLRTRANRPKEERQDGEVDERFWELLLSADKKDYERICAEYGVTDFRWMLKKLNEKKREIEEQQAQYVEYLSNLKHIEIKTPGCAQFEFEMDLRDPNAKILLYKDGELVEFSADTSEKHSLRRVGRRFIFSVSGLSPDDAGLYQVDVEGVNIFSTDFKLPNVDFLVKIKEVTAIEREDAVFECVLSAPVPKITWMGKNVALAQGQKYDITVSEDMLIHRLVVKDCMLVDKGIYAAMVGIKSCNAWLLVEADNDSDKREKKVARKTTQAGGSGIDLEKAATEQQAKIQKAREERKAVLKQCQADQAAEAPDNEAEPPVKLPVEPLLNPVAQPAAEQIPQTSQNNKDKTKTKPKAKPKSVSDGMVKAPKEEAIEQPKEEVKDEPKEEAIEQPKEEAIEEPKEEVIEEQKGNVIEEQKGDMIEVKKVPQKAVTKHEESGQVMEDKQQSEPVSEEQGEEKKKRVRTGPLIPDTEIDQGVYFTSGLHDVRAIVGHSAEMVCMLSNTNYDGVWYKDGKEIKSTDDLMTIKDGALHKLVIKNCTEDDNGKYRFEADGRKTEALLTVEDPPRMNQDDLTKFSQPVTIKVGQNATFKLSFVGREPIKVQWYHEGEELLEDINIKIERSFSHSRLLLTKCQRKDTGEIKLKLKNEFGITEAFSKLIVLDKPSNPLGPIEVIEASSSCVEFKWRPPKDDGGSPVIHYNLERQQIGRNTWKKIGNTAPVAHYKDTDVDHGRKYCYRIRAITAEGTSDVYETDEVQAGTKAYPGPPSTPNVVSAFKDCINLSWSPPTKTGGTTIVGYNLEKRKKGSNLWNQVNPLEEPIKAKQYGVKDVVEGIEYEFRVIAINFSGAGEPSSPSDFVIARDPKKPPGKVIDLKVSDSTYSSLSLSWTKPKEQEGAQAEAKGYFVELRPAENTEWTRCNSHEIITTSYTILGLKSMAMYWVRVVATNEGGEGEPQNLDNYIIAMPPPVKPNFTDRKMKSFMVVRTGHSVRVNIQFEGSPMPTINWLKDGMPPFKHVTISNTEGTSQLLIPSAERSDTGVYTIIVKNMVGQETFSTEIRVTDDPKSPGPVELEENVPGTLTVCWSPSPDEKRDDRLHYMVAKRDSVKQTWHTVADRVFNNSFTAVNIMPGREYNFRVYAKNDIGLSEPSESPTWGRERKKEKFTLSMPEHKTFNLESPPTITVPMKTRTSPEKYECHMTCAVRGNPTPYVTWYRNNISLNTNTNYYITNTCGVCSLKILRVGPKDNGEYKVVAENSLGRAECTTQLKIRE
ncbi:immunoglobulin-like and fibronectin type III domain-containing protein 1 [Hemibagrus wyckioides]|uniref:immunoglobulin-like and fibronectin type III domain-containing protein 1 n=1 Tax=Hemibagrus wyckioides TaxID=337641 RepID=UPI00266B8E2E|nr:immunoglobulin-like and fibronectin type III domain-containing protein 1 [Hemibagrus wyckioides]